MPQTFVLPRQLALDEDANPLAGALLYFFQTGTTVPQAVYSDIGLTTQHPHPVPADASGEWPKIYLNSEADVNYRVRITSATGTQLYQEDDIERFTVSTAEIGRALYPQTTAEAAASIVPANNAFSEGDIRRYGAVSGGDCTAAVQTAMDLAYTLKGEVYIPEGTWPCDPGLLLTFTDTRYNTGFTIRGDGPGSILSVRGTPTDFNFLELRGATPTAAPFDAIITVRDLTILKSGTVTGSGLVLNNIANFLLINVMIRGFDRNLYLLSPLVGTVHGSHFTDGHTGVYCRQNGYPGTTGSTAGSTVNLIDFDAGCRFNYNTSWGIDFDHGSGLTIDGDVEANGTSGNANTGGIRIGPNLAPDSQVATIKLYAWFENNFGTQIKAEAQAVTSLNLEINPRALLASQSGRAMIIEGANSVWVHDVTCGPGEIWDITATKVILSNCTTDTLDVTASYKIYENVGTALVQFPFGQTYDLLSLTLTGVSSSIPGGQLVAVKQGNMVWLRGGSYLGVSNTTACTLGTLQAELRPAAPVTLPCVVQDNSTQKFAYMSIGSDGVITLSNGFSSTFTGSGNKGLDTVNAWYHAAS